MSTTVRPHDFSRTETLDRHYLGTFTAAFDAFARHASVELSTLMRRTAQLSLSRISEKPWRDVTALLGGQPYLATFALDPLHGSSILSAPLPCALRLVDFRLGGGSRPHFDRHATATETDLAVLAGMVRPLLENLAESLSRLREVTAQLVAQDTGIQFVQMAGPSEMFLVVELELGVGADPPDQVIAALPFGVVRQLVDALRSGPGPGVEADERVDETVVLQTPLELWVEVPAIRLTPSEVSELAVGDVIRFFHPLDRPLDVRAGGVLVARARHGRVGSKLVCSITEEVAEDDR